MEGRNPQVLKEGGWREREPCCTESLLDAFSRGNGTFSCQCGFEPLAVRHVLGPLAAGALKKGRPGLRVMGGWGRKGLLRSGA